MPRTEAMPKCYTVVAGRRILDWILAALRQGGVTEICFIGGYYIDAVRRDYPDFIFRHNDDWPNNNILASLMYARDLMDEPFVATYSDILYTPEIVKGLIRSGDDIALGVDTAWRQHYADRTCHPPSDAEKVTAKAGRVTRIGRDIPPAEAYGEFIGVARFSAVGAGQLLEHYDRGRELFGERPYRGGRPFRKAYLIELLQEMIAAGLPLGHVDTPGLYREIDTLEDLRNAERSWRG